MPALSRRLATAVLFASAAAAPARAVAQAAPAAARADSARPDSARPTYTPADVQFMSMMIGHHAQAITMARMAPTHGASPSVRTLADRIINAQQDEIATMQQWLRDRRQPVPQPSAPGAHAMAHDAMAHDAMAHDAMSHDAMSHDAMAHDMAMPMPGAQAASAPAPAAAHTMSMPGMLSAAQLAQLGQAKGREFDRLFLTGMIQHHRGAVSMVQSLFGTYGAGQDETVFKFASDVNVDQTTEIARMQQMLAALLFGPS